MLCLSKVKQLIGNQNSKSLFAIGYTSYTFGAFRKLYHTDSCSLVKALLVMPFCAPSPAAPGGSCPPPFTSPRYNYATEVVRQVVGQQTGSDNWLETSGYGTCGVRQVVGDNWRKHGWLATPGLSHLDYTVSPKRPPYIFLNAILIIILGQGVALTAKSSSITDRETEMIFKNIY